MLFLVIGIALALVALAILVNASARPRVLDSDTSAPTDGRRKSARYEKHNV